MKAAVLHGTRDLRIEDVAVPVAGPGEILLRVATVGVCGTDHSEWWHGPRNFPIDRAHPVTGHFGPMVLGHEFSGTVEATGPGVDAAWLGRRVTSSAAVSCGACAPCRSHRSNLCSTYHGVGLHRHGALAEFAAVPVSCLLDINDSPLSLDEAALAQPMAIAHHAVRRGAPPPQSTVLVQGVGGVGAFIVRVLTEQGHTVIAVDVASARLDVAAGLGAKVCLRPGDLTEPDEARALPDAIERYGIDVAFEVSGNAAALDHLRASLPVGARIVLVGIHKAGTALDLGAMTVREQELIGTNGLVHAQDLPAAVRTLEGNAGRWSGVAPHVYPLDDVSDEVLSSMSGTADARPIKALIDPREAARRPLRESTPMPATDSR